MPLQTDSWKKALVNQANIDEETKQIKPVKGKSRQKQETPLTI
jgi:hypothetical protein